MKNAVCIIIVNYRTADLVVDCLYSLSIELASNPKWQIVVVDNDSGDGSINKLVEVTQRETWGNRVAVMSAGRNGGFSFGNNFGIRYAMTAPGRFDYIMLLNPDTIVRENAVKALVDAMVANQRAGVAGSLLENDRGAVECSAHTFPSPLSEFDGGIRLGMISSLLSRYVVTPPPRKESHVCDWVSGASMLIRKEVISDIGLMDEGYFLYFEEVDFCRRAKSAGWECWYVPTSRVMHLEGASTLIHSAAKRRPAYWYNSRRRYFIKHHGVNGLVFADLLWAFGRTTYLLRRWIGIGAKGERYDPTWFMFDLLWGDLRAFFSGEFRGVRQKR